ncbi:hypothetical protein P692DRAFT_20948083 [Suillus brevipes Sb2]|nr:hypothetical protein P692DRAFT_20948083 [Suillus brevipes Sb2]
MTERAKRGLLTEEEKLILAQEEATRAQEVRMGGKECRVITHILYRTWIYPTFDRSCICLNPCWNKLMANTSKNKM